MTVSLAERIAPHLPALRRFGRLLTGSQQAGDAAVARVLQAIAADPSVFPDLPPRVGLYHCFLAALTRWHRPHGSSPGLGDTAARSLAALTPESLQAFLLISVEGFERADTAQIMNVSEQRIDTLLSAAEAEIAAQLATNVLIIEDEPLIAMDLHRVLKSLGHRVTSIARSHREALWAAAREEPGLVLADIQLADGSSGIDAVNEILSVFSVPVVFVTAHLDKLTTGNSPEPTFLIPKPYREEAVKAIVSQVLFFDQRAQPARGTQSPSTSV